MSDSFVRWVPLHPSFVPSSEAQERAVEWLLHRAPAADDHRADVSPTIRFVDCGANLEANFCPRCSERIDEWWWGEMDRFAETQFER